MFLLSVFVSVLIHSLTIATARTDVNRSMVTVSISFLAPDRDTAKAFQAQVVQGVRIAIADQVFTKMELGA